MEFTFTIHAKGGQIQINGPLNDIPLCLGLLAEGQKALAQLMRQEALQQQQTHKTLLMPDGSAAPPAFLGKNRVNGQNGNVPK